MELWHDEACKCGPIRQVALQQLLYKGSWRDLVLCQTGTTGSFLYNAVMFLELVQMAFNVGALTHVNYQLYSYDLPLKSDWINNRTPVSLLSPFFWIGWHPDLSTALSACLLVWGPEHLSSLMQMLILLRLWFSFLRNLITLCWKPVYLVNLTSG